MSITKTDNKTMFKGGGHGLDGLKLLIADDDQLNIFVVQKILSRWDIEADVAENGMVAVEKVRATDYDLVLMDVQMPVMDGLGATIEIKRFKPHIPIVIITSLPQESVSGNFGKLGITEIIFKPVKAEKLYEILMKYAVKKSGGASK